MFYLMTTLIVAIHDSILIFSAKWLISLAKEHIVSADHIPALHVNKEPAIWAQCRRGSMWVPCDSRNYFEVAQSFYKASVICRPAKS